MKKQPSLLFMHNAHTTFPTVVTPESPVYVFSNVVVPLQSFGRHADTTCVILNVEKNKCLLLLFVQTLIWCSLKAFKYRSLQHRATISVTEYFCINLLFTLIAKHQTTVILIWLFNPNILIYCLFFLVFLICSKWLFELILISVRRIHVFLATRTHSHVNTLYLKLQCPAVRPPLVVTSNNPHNIVDFDRVIVGEWHLQKHETRMCSKPFLDFVTFICRTEGYQKDDTSEHLPWFFICILL